MQYFVERGLSHKETMEKIKTKYGEQAKIMTFKTVHMGGFLGFGIKEGIEMAGYVQPEPVKRKNLDLDDEKRKIIAAAGTVQKPELTLQDVMKEIQELKEKVGTAEKVITEAHPTLLKIDSLLEMNEFSRAYINFILDEIKKKFTLETLDNFDTVQRTVVDLIGGTISVNGKIEFSGRKILAVIGPTGVGKTTTIAKLAAVYGRIGEGGLKPVDVRIITADNYRIGAVNQLEVYGKIMEIPFASVDSKEEFKKRLELFGEADLILVDTSGRSPKNYASLGEMQDMLEGCRHVSGAGRLNGSSTEFHLTLSATTKTADIQEVLQQFEPFKYEAVILTKLDETMRIGNVLSALWEKKKSISYITYGQGVPSDISRATVPELLKYLDGFFVDQEHIQEKFTHN
ncbi:MAG: flagellar biosynthesis protein FlhF [Spirochaetales bacterium]|nr:MAG: flagellar biosynthesis protein FlhF [Spirochaetales bacterium]